MEIDIGAIIILFLVFCSLIVSTIYYYNKYTNLLNTEIRLYKLKSIFHHNPNLYPEHGFHPYKKITIDTFLSAINNPEEPFVEYN